jgi:hypothetical protein
VRGQELAQARGHLGLALGRAAGRNVGETQFIGRGNDSS